MEAQAIDGGEAKETGDRRGPLGLGGDRKPGGEAVEQDWKDGSGDEAKQDERGGAEEGKSQTADDAKAFEGFQTDGQEVGTEGDAGVKEDTEVAKLRLELDGVAEKEEAWRGGGEEDGAREEDGLSLRKGEGELSGGGSVRDRGDG